jgi:hypothetical protein
MRPARVGLVLAACGLAVVATGTGIVAQGKPAQGKAAAKAPAAPSLVVVGIRVVGPGLGDGGTELRAFDSEAGTRLALVVKPPAGSFIIDVDEDASTLDAFTDDKDTNLLEEGRFGPFPKVAANGSAGIFEIETRGRPTAGAAAVTATGTLAMSVATGSKPTKVPNVKLEPGKVIKFGTFSWTLKEVSQEGESTSLTVTTTTAAMQAVKQVRFLDAKGQPVEGDRNGASWSSTEAEVNYRVQTAAKAITIEFDLWQGRKALTVPFTVTSGLSLTP